MFYNEAMTLIGGTGYTIDRITTKNNTEPKTTITVTVTKDWLQNAYRERRKQEADGCVGCTFASVEEWEMPCVRCKRGCKDYWRTVIYD